MIRTNTIWITILALACTLSAYGQGEAAAQADKPKFEDAASSVQQNLEAALAELSKLREEMAAEKIPLSRKLNELESELIDVRQQYQKITRDRDNTILGKNRLNNDIKAWHEVNSYLSGLLGEYVRNFESRLHIAEKQRYAKTLETAQLATENSALSSEQVFATQEAVIVASLDRLFDALGGTKFEGSAVDPGELFKQGTFVMMGPSAIFMTGDNQLVGTVEQRMGEPTVIPYTIPEDTDAAMQVATASTGAFPLDPTLGNAHKIAETEETWLEHVKKGGPVMYPIFALAAAALLVALFKWLTFLFVRKPSRRGVGRLLNAIAHHDLAGAQAEAKAMRGPAGKMLRTGVEHIDEPRDLIEEVMYERVLSTRLKLQRMLPFIQISAAAAPLLGLLGTVTGIIATFKLITLFGTGDVKTLSGGISEALITTEYGLIVAIPSLLLHAFLSRKARGIIDQMEKVGVAFVNQVSKSKFGPKETPQPAADSTQNVNVTASDEQVRKVVSQMFEQLVVETRPVRPSIPASSTETSARHQQPVGAGHSNDPERNV